MLAALRELPGTDLGRLFVKGMSENSPREAVQRHTLSTMRLIEIFSGRSKLVPGDTFAMDFVPGKGTQICFELPLEVIVMAETRTKSGYAGLAGQRLAVAWVMRRMNDTTNARVVRMGQIR